METEAPDLICPRLKLSVHPTVPYCPTVQTISGADQMEEWAKAPISRLFWVFQINESVFVIKLL
jgi:hypothetical protein